MKWKKTKRVKVKSKSVLFATCGSSHRAILKSEILNSEFLWQATVLKKIKSKIYR